MRPARRQSAPRYERSLPRWADRRRPRNSNTLFGGPGNDTLVGGSGATSYFGGPGNDRLMAANGRRDSVNCGTGTDTAYVDPIDIVRTCKRVFTAR